MSEEKSNRHGGAPMPRQEEKKYPLHLDNRAKDRLDEDGKKREEMRAKKGPVKVVALADGFYGNQRMKPGDKFTIASGEHWGAWMKEI